MLSDGHFSSRPISALGRRTPQDVRREIVRRLRDHRIARQWTQREMARRAGIKFETFRAFERTGQVSLNRFLRILDVLGLLDEIEIASPSGARTIDEVITPRAKPLRQRARRSKRTPTTEI
jgi:transcriptional regulator with XRE-family HTH domain